MINTINATLDCAPESLNSIDMSSTTDILLGYVLYYLMGITKPLNLVVTWQLISKDDGFIISGIFDHRQLVSR